MTTKSKEYHKLPGIKKGFLIGRYSLWQGRDHLLHIYSRMGVEDYKRFYFNDIQAIITRKTGVGKVQNGVLGGFILLFTLSVITFERGWSIFYGITAGIMLIFLLVNLIKGPTCETRIMTAVQTEKLPSMHRMNRTLKVMDRLRPSIELAQGTVTSEDLNKIPMQPTVNSASAGAAKSAGLRKAAPQHEKGRAHMILYALLLFNGALATLEFFFNHVFMTILSSATGIVMGIFVIIALVRQHDSDMTATLRTITWTTLGFVCIHFAAGYAVSMVFALKSPGFVYNQWEVLKAVSTLSPWENPLLLSLNIFALGGALFLGIPGFIMLKRSEERVNSATAATTVMACRPVISSNSQAG